MLPTASELRRPLITSPHLLVLIEGSPVNLLLSASVVSVWQLGVGRSGSQVHLIAWQLEVGRMHVFPQELMNHFTKGGGTNFIEYRQCTYPRTQCTKDQRFRY